MKFTLILVLLSVFQLSASVYSQNSSLSLDMKNRSVKEVLKQIEELSEFRFFYNEEYLDLNRNVSLSVENIKVEEILEEIFEGTNISFKVMENKLIAITPAIKESFTNQPIKKITGKVSDSKGEFIPGVTIVIKGSSRGTVSDFEGNFLITNVPDDAVLVFSFVGMKSEEVAVDGKETIDAVLESGDININEVVVTALGLTREAKALGYSVQSVDGDDFVESKEIDVVNSLAGKIAGVHITQGDGGVAGGGSRIVIRGESSLAGNNDPMYVIDGIPASSINDITSEDIASVTVLKGPAASALYGSRAGAGVILITTKEGPRNGKLNIEVNSSVSISNPLIIPEVQKIYGQGEAGDYSSRVGESWGPKFDGRQVEQHYGSNVWKYNDTPKDFYQTGTVFTNNVSLSGNNETGRFRLSFTNLEQEGMVPNTDYSENRVDLTSGWTFWDGKFDIKANVKYANSGSDNNQGGADPRFMPRNYELDKLKDYWTEKDANGNPIEGGKVLKVSENGISPYFSLYENQYWNKRDRYVGNVTVNVDITNELSLLLRTGTNGYVQENRNFGKAADIGGASQYGSFSHSLNKGYEMNSDFLLSYDKKINSDIRLKTSVGGNMMSTNGSYINGSNSQLEIADFYSLSNHRVYPGVSSAYDLHEKTNSIYAFANVGYKEALFLDFTARNDWTSTLKYKENDSYLYYSASMSLLLDKVLDMGDTFDMFKLKANYATVGNDISKFELDQKWNWQGAGSGRTRPSVGNTKAFSDLKPEETQSFELGANAIMLNGRLGVDVTYYNSTTENQIWKMDVTDLLGYDYVWRNIGKVESKGMEITIDAVPVKVNRFKWTSTINWSLDRTELAELDPSIDLEFLTHDIHYGVNAIDKVGERRGALYTKVSRKFEYDATVHDASLQQYDGYYYYSGNHLPADQEMQIVGNYNPDWFGSWNNRFEYGNLSLSAMLYVNYGGTHYSAVGRKLANQGLDIRTLENRDGGILPENSVWDSPDGIRPFQSGEEINTEDYWKFIVGSGEHNDFWMTSGTYVKLKEVVLGYTLPKRWMSRSFFKDVKLSIAGRNLALWTDIDHVDPETYKSDDGKKFPGLSYEDTLPSARTFTFNLRMKF